jgi:hypothetical protein
MKSFLFENIWMLSRRDRRARSEEFHPRKNLIVGGNHVGKSSLIKTLFVTLGAKPSGDLDQWDEGTISVVAFRFDGRRYLAVHQYNSRALFGPDDELIAVASTHRAWTEVFAKVVGFNLVLTDKRDKTAPADPRCFFLPFYINQDGSWQATWDTFSGMQQFRAPVGAILDYFAGIKPPEYYEVSARRTHAQRSLDELRREKVLLERTRDRLGKAVGESGPKLQPTNFLLEVSQLTTHVTELNERQEQLRDIAVREQEALAEIRLQIQLAVHVLATYEGDFMYLREQSHQTLTCPTCDAEHKKPFGDILTYAEDARVLRELVARLRVEGAAIFERWQKTKASLSDLDIGYRRVSAVLDTRRGDLRFGDVVKSIAAENALSAFESEFADLKKRTDEYLSEIDKLGVRLRQLSDAARSKEILEVFRRSYSAALESLNLPPVDTTRLKLTSRPDLSGSGGPRSVLAYYAALWRACVGVHGSFLVPLVVDAPNQQGQDGVNLPKVLAFVSAELPAGPQIIVGSELDTGHPFDKRIVLDQEYRLLGESEYDSVGGFVEPLVKAMYDSLREQDVG